jgi:hypothetical protein
MASDDKILDQLDNDSNVIGYYPDLRYVKPRTATGEAISGNGEESYDPEKDTTLYTKTLNGFADNTPSTVLNDINYVLKNIKRLKYKLADKFNEDMALSDNPFYKNSDNGFFNAGNPTGNTSPSGNVTPSGGITPPSGGNPSGNLSPSGGVISTSPTINPVPNGTVTGGITGNVTPNSRVYDPYGDISQLIEGGDTGNIEFTKKFEEKYNDVYGNVIPSLINKLSNIETKLNNLSSSFKDIYYGRPNISYNEAKEIDDAYIKDMKLRERNGDRSTINYLTTSFDSLLNKMVSFCVYQDNKSAINVAKVIDSHEDVRATSNDMNIVKKIFDDIEKELDIRSRGYQRNEDFELIQKSMYNYYEKRKYLNDTYTLYKNNPDSVFLGRKVQEYSKQLNEAVKDVSRVLLYNQNYLNKITSLENQKYNLQKISRSVSSNS